MKRSILSTSKSKRCCHASIRCMATSIRHLNPYRETLSLPAGPPLDRMQSEDASAHWAALSHHQSRATFQGVPASFMSRNAVRVHSLITISKRPTNPITTSRILHVASTVEASISGSFRFRRPGAKRPHKRLHRRDPLAGCRNSRATATTRSPSSERNRTERCVSTCIDSTN